MLSLAFCCPEANRTERVFCVFRRRRASVALLSSLFSFASRVIPFFALSRFSSSLLSVILPCSLILACSSSTVPRCFRSYLATNASVIEKVA